MHGLGNDFVVIDNSEQTLHLTSTHMRHLADRHFGVGCDQILLIEHSDRPEIDFRYRIFNADGSEVEQCGNGVRCFARYVIDKGLTDKAEIAVETSSGIIYPQVNENLDVTVNMGVPRLTPQEIPFDAPHQAASYSISAGEQELTIGAVSMGNPHAVVSVDNVDTAPVSELALR